MTNFWDRAARTNAEVDRELAYEQRLRAEQQAQEQREAYEVSLRPVMPEHQAGTEAWIAARAKRFERNQAATAASAAAGYVNLSDMRVRAHERAVQQYGNHARLTDPAAYVAQQMGGGQAPGYGSGAPQSAYSDIG
ncbi:hypothetical protein [Streptomyces sp. NPDC058157]|uniref:hypothetical protein n=1 Tax=Streptomyces sp. NPDC058157 TaxID=3346360 RepID=UPI0036E52D51